jgi:hypothetical protein
MSVISQKNFPGYSSSRAACIALADALWPPPCRTIYVSCFGNFILFLQRKNLDSSGCEGAYLCRKGVAGCVCARPCAGCGKSALRVGHLCPKHGFAACKKYPLRYEYAMNSRYYVIFAFGHKQRVVVSSSRISGLDWPREKRDPKEFRDSLHQVYVHSEVRQRKHILHDH